ncbi:MAG: DNA polymerase III subunit delta [Aphanocapsa sp. GSE-SYN-MK-11-07L]|nr:DNA polymerase III subunit delta [Aphanocapsa sp. GSE-SYN-MK-11-07L]
MPAYFYWGEDEYRLTQAVQALRDRILDPTWLSFNFDKIGPEQPDAIVQALNQVMTLPFGSGGRLVWLVNTSLGQRCAEEVLTELERTLPDLPEAGHLLLTSPNKPDGRSKAVKLLQKYAQVKEFSQIPAWKTDELSQEIRQAARQIGVKLTPDAVELLVNAVGNDTRQLHNELEKLRLYGGPSTGLTAQEVALLVTTSTQNSLQLAEAIRQADTSRALNLVADLIQQNEAPLRIVATLIRQFRTWLWIKLMAGEQDLQAIAKAAEVSNPKRVYFLQKEVQRVSLPQLQQALPLLLQLEVSLKQGSEANSSLQIKVIELCHLFRL